jgi:hypothetical protein
MTSMPPILNYDGKTPTAYDLAVAQYYKGGGARDAGSKLTKEQELMSQVEAAKKDSQLAGQIMGNYLPPGVAYAKVPGAPARGAPRLAPYLALTRAVRAGSLQVLLKPHEPPPLPLHFITLAGRQAPLKLRAFTDFVAPRLPPRLVFDDRL